MRIVAGESFVFDMADKFCNLEPFVEINLFVWLVSLRETLVIGLSICLASGSRENYEKMKLTYLAICPVVCLDLWWIYLTGHGH